MLSTSHKILAPLVATLALAASFHATAATVDITFDAGDPIGGLAAGSTLSNQYAGVGVLFSPNAFAGPSTTLTDGLGSWADNTDMTVVSSTGAGPSSTSAVVGNLGTPSLVSGNILRSFGNWLNEDGDPSFMMSFTAPVFSVSVDFAGVGTSSDVKLYAYNGKTLLGVVSGMAASSDTNPTQFTLSFGDGAQITSAVVVPGDGNDWVGVDNIQFTTPLAAVPEPSMSATLSLGLILIGATCIRRRRNSIEKP